MHEYLKNLHIFLKVPQNTFLGISNDSKHFYFFSLTGAAPTCTRALLSWVWYCITANFFLGL